MFAHTQIACIQVPSFKFAILTEISFAIILSLLHAENKTERLLCVNETDVNWQELFYYIPCLCIECSLKEYFTVFIVDVYNYMHR